MDVIWIWHHRGFLCDKQLFYTPCGNIVEAKSLKSALVSGDGEVIDRKFRTAALLQRQALTYEETVMLGALALMSPGTFVRDVMTSTSSPYVLLYYSSFTEICARANYM